MIAALSRSNIRSAAWSETASAYPGITENSFARSIRRRDPIVMMTLSSLSTLFEATPPAYRPGRAGGDHRSQPPRLGACCDGNRSEERRVGKEGEWKRVG